MNSFISKSLDANRYWLRIMKEHAIFIQAGLPCGRPDLIQEAKFFEKQYDGLLKLAKQMMDPSEKEVSSLNNQSYCLTLKFIKYKTAILEYNLLCKMPLQNLYALLIDHIRREAILFTQELQKIQFGIVDIPGFKIMSEQMFWTRIMADHSKFIVNLLDPSERGLEKQARGFSDLFDDLKQQAIDLEGMISPSYMIIPTIDRFTGEVIEATEKLRDFKKTGRDLIGECKILSEIPELLADHVMREAEHFLKLLGEHKELIGKKKKGE